MNSYRGNRIVQKIFITFFILSHIELGSPAFGQRNLFDLNSYKPVSPSAFEFAKVQDNAVELYSGAAKVAIPLFDLTIGGQRINGTMQYATSGIRVSEEASWVGLGWSMNFEGISQVVNDADDLGDITDRRRPDWYQSPTPTEFQRKYYNYTFYLLDPAFNNQYPIFQAKPAYSYKTFPGYRIVNYAGPVSYSIPVSGRLDDWQLNQEIVSLPYYDSEPDLFTANFFWPSIKVYS